MGVHTRRQLDLPVVLRDHHAGPRLADELGREALRLGFELQAAATVLVPEQARDLRRRRRRRVVRLAVVVYALEAVAGVAAAGPALGWWPNPLA